MVNKNSSRELGNCPLVSLIIVVRNELDQVDRALESLLQQDYPQELTEIILVDGMSDDGTREFLHKRAEELRQEGRRVKVLDNPSKILASGWNIAIKNAEGDVVCRIDAHSEIYPDYVSRGIEELVKRQKDGYVCVGGVIAENVGKGRTSAAIAALFSSRFGVGNSYFRTGVTAPRETDTAVFGLYWRKVFEEVGYFNEALGRNQDLELHQRIRKRGYKFLTHPDLKIRYYVRNTVPRLIRKAWQDGFWIGVSWSFSWRHLVPFFFVLYLVLTLLTFWWAGKAVLIPFLLYLVLAVIFGLKDGKSWRSRIILPVLFFLFHVSYGAGTMGGFLHFLLTKLLRCEQRVQYLSFSQRFFKRAFDVVFSFLGLLLTFWIIILAFILATVDTRSCGFFIQERVGLHGKIFKLIKIRTMRVVPSINTVVTTKDDPRITPLGRFFRKTKIDELPQLINVFLGQMSFVGPRPDVPGFADTLEGEEKDIILSVRPGITGPATLKYRDEEELLAQVENPEEYNREVIFPDKVKINKDYVINYSFLNDIKYILLTIFGGSVKRILRWERES